jgi:predicted small integral membrane protein
MRAFLGIAVHGLIIVGLLFVLLVVVFNVVGLLWPGMWRRDDDDWKRETPMRPDDYRRKDPDE